MVIDSQLASILTDFGEDIDMLLEMYPGIVKGIVKVEATREIGNDGVNDRILVTFANGYLRSISRRTTQYSASFKPEGMAEVP